MLKYRQEVAPEQERSYIEAIHRRSQSNSKKITKRIETGREETNQAEALRLSVGQDVRDEWNKIKNVFIDSSL